MRRVLIVSPHFPPTNAPDMQRVRLTLPFLRQFGWTAEVLAVEPDQVAAPKDQWLLTQLPPDVLIHRVRGLGLKWSRVPGLGGIDYRTLLALQRGGERVLAQNRFDLVYFSTTVFPVHTLGARWARTLRLPFVMDYQDPWVTDYYRRHRNLIPPGGRVKYAAVSAIGRLSEPYVLRHCAGLTSVSDDYPRQLWRRYSFTRRIPALVMPFPAAKRDLQEGTVTATGPRYFDPHDGNTHWVYVGVSGPIMYRSLRAMFRALQRYRGEMPTFVDSLRIHFIGTSYAPAGSALPVVTPLAKQYGLEHIVSEKTDRIPYSSALRCIKDADALLIPGTDDAGYNPSKLLGYLLARKPLLAVLHKDSPGIAILRDVGGATAISFSEGDSEAMLAERIHKSWLASGVYKKVLPLQEERMFRYTDRGSAASLCNFFDEIMCRGSLRRCQRWEFGR